jgi:hypothetical protein
LSSICITWPSQAILLLFINLTVSAFSIVRSVRNSFWLLHKQCRLYSGPSSCPGPQFGSQSKGGMIFWLSGLLCT